MVWVSILKRGKRFFFSTKCPDRPLGLPNLLFSRHWDSFPGVKQSGCEVNHSPPSRAKVKNEWKYTSAAAVCLHGIDRNTLFY
jgi:hypothetical protein